ncbi:hypothetical protein D3C76_1278200 [compost metagenome]
MQPGNSNPVLLGFRVIIRVKCTIEWIGKIAVARGKYLHHRGAFHGIIGSINKGRIVSIDFIEIKVLIF